MKRKAKPVCIFDNVLTMDAPHLRHTTGIDGSGSVNKNTVSPFRDLYYYSP